MDANYDAKPLRDGFFFALKALSRKDLEKLQALPLEKFNKQKVLYNKIQKLTEESYKKVKFSKEQIEFLISILGKNTWLIAKLENAYNWTSKKLKNLAVADACERLMKKEVEENSMNISEKRINRMRGCATYLRFAVETLDKKSKKRLTQANFCRDRFCPHCQKRRSMMLFSQFKRLLETWVEGFNGVKAKPAFLLLTLTIPNCKAEDLGATIDQMLQGFNRLFKLKDLDFVKGYFRTLETTYNQTRDDYHPHIHVVMGIHESYFSHNYLSKEKWLQLWKQSMRRDDIKVVNILKVRDKKDLKRVEKTLEEGQKEGLDPCDMMAGILETAKYCVKPSDYLDFDEEKSQYVANEEVLGVLMEHLKGRRLIAYGRDFDEIRKKLKDQDVDEADLIKLNAEEDQEPFSPMYEVLWRWVSDLGRYGLVHEKENFQNRVKKLNEGIPKKQSQDNAG
jgi:plasmid rolling circle replication initiator protein Rep